MTVPSTMRIRAWFLILLTSSIPIQVSAAHSQNVLTSDLHLPQYLIENLAQYAPYHPVDTYKCIEKCQVVQVNILQRHGARWPTSSVSTAIQKALTKLKAVPTFNDKNFEFIRDYKYKLGTDALVPYGASESYDAGSLTFKRYPHLASEYNPPFIRASDSERVILSATNWTKGFFDQSHIESNYPVIISEAATANNTLDNNDACPKLGDSSAQTTKWLSTFAPPITSRLNTAAPGANLTDQDTLNLMHLCAFDTMDTMKQSNFCGLFTPKDFIGYEYWGDVGKYYGTGHGQPLGPAQGVGYVNELLSRLTGSPVKDSTKTNSTLDSSPTTFPLDRGIYADFSHDNQMVAIYSAMGLFADPPLSLITPDPNRLWVLSKLVPFAARMVTEKLECGGKEFVRVLVDDAVMPLKNCNGVQDGICELGEFVKSQAFATGKGQEDWLKCF